jgi:hypothetical protein
VHVAARNEEVTGASFDEAGGRAEILNLPRIGRCCNQYRISAGFRWTMNIRQQCDSVTHWNCNIVIVCHCVGGLRQIAILAAGGLGTIEAPLIGFDS